MMSCLENKVEIVLADNEHITPIAQNIRIYDRQEFCALGTVWSLEYELKVTMDCSLHAFTALINDEPVVMFGVIPLNVLAGSGVPWLVASQKIENHSVKFLKYSKPLLACLVAQFPDLRNSVHVDNHTTKRWLEWMGFQIKAPVNIGNGLFCPFQYKGKSSCVP